MQRRKEGRKEGRVCSLRAAGRELGVSTFTCHVADILNCWEGDKGLPSDTGQG